MAIGRKTGGRKPGSLNKRTKEKLEQARLDDNRGRELARTIAAPEVHAPTVTARLAKNELEEVIPVIRGMLAYYQSTPPQALAAGIPNNPNANAGEFKAWMQIFVDATMRLARFQSPTFSAVMIGATTVNKITVTGGLPDEEDGGLVNADADPRLQRSEDRAAQVSSGPGESVQGEGEAESPPVRKALG